MTVTIKVNGASNSLVHQGSGGVSQSAPPDVCLTPMGNAVVPIPYPNVAFSSDLANGSTTVLADGGNSIATQASQFSKSTGDEPGSNGGVASGTVANIATFVTYSNNVIIEGQGASRLGDMMKHNNGNTMSIGVQQPPVAPTAEITDPPELKYDEQFLLLWPDETPASNYGYQLKVNGAVVASGKTDADGWTSLYSGTEGQQLTLTLIDPPPPSKALPSSSYQKPTNVRPVATKIAPDGSAYGESFLSPVNFKLRAQLIAPARTVVPIIFVPGIMGSNLKASKTIKRPSSGATLAEPGDKIWRVDSTTSLDLAQWAITRQSTRQMLLNKDVTEVDDGGVVKKSALNRITEETARARGWGEVAWAFYGPFLGWLEDTLNNAAIDDGADNSQLQRLMSLAGKTPDDLTRPKVEQPIKTVGARPAALTAAQVRKLMRIHFPVHACGYNWLDTNLNAGQRIKERIEKVIQLYNGKNGQVCEKVILMTHSMGGLAARGAVIAAGAQDKVQAVIHGVQPVFGAAAAYKRFVAGFSGEGAGSTVSQLLGWVQSQVLGATGPEATCVLAYAPGGMELLPSPYYNNGKPWLFIEGENGSKESYPQGDVYEMYKRQDVFWRLINPDWLNPAGADMGKSPLTIHQQALGRTRKYHAIVTDRLHPNTYGYYGKASKDSSGYDTLVSWGNCIWKTEVGWQATKNKPTDPEPSATWYPWNGTPAEGSSADWKVVKNDQKGTLTLKGADGHLIKAQIKPRADDGDGTVPADASGAGVNKGVLACTIEDCDHAACYDPEQHPEVSMMVLDFITRIAQDIEVS